MKINDLRRLRSGLIVCFLAGLSGPSWGCGLKQGVPHEHFKGVNSVGKVSYWTQLDQIDLGNGLSLPLNINFRSDRNKKSPYLGKGWMLPFLEQGFVQRNEKIFAMREPNGYVIPFRRSKNDNTLLRGREGWMASITGDHTIKAYASCGWSLDFTDGKISDMHTPDNRDISFVYQGGVVTSVQINGVPLLTVNLDSQTNKVTGLSYNGKEIGFEEGNRPIVHHQHGVMLIAAVTQSLHKVTLPGGKIETFDFAVDNTMKPTLKVAGADSHSFTWSPRTRKVLKDGDWTYKVVIAPRKDRMVRGGRRFANAQIQRTNPKGQTESWFRDLKNGTTTIQKLDGTKITKDHFVGSGLAGKMRKVVKTENGKSVVTFQGTYDENHHLVRKIDGSGNTYAWKKDGNDRVYTENNVPLRKVTYDETGRPIHEADLTTKIETSYTYSDQGSQEITHFPNGRSFLESFDTQGKSLGGRYLNNQTENENENKSSN